MDNLFTHTDRQTSARRNSPTSVAAAKQAEPRAGSQMSRYLTELVKARRHGLTDHEAADKLGLPVGTICARRGSEYGRRYVRDSGRRRKSVYGSDNVVWIHVMYAGTTEAA